MKEITDIDYYNEWFDILSKDIIEQTKKFDKNNSYSIETEIVGKDLDKRLLVYSESIGFKKQKELFYVLRATLRSDTGGVVMSSHNRQEEYPKEVLEWLKENK